LELSLAVAADYASTTAEGKLNILGIFDQLNAPGFPLTLPQFFVVLVLVFGPQETDRQVTVRIQLVDGKDAEIVALQGVVTTPPEIPEGRQQGLLNQLIGLSGVSFHRHGAHRFRVFLDGLEQKPIYLYVRDASEQLHVQ